MAVAWYLAESLVALRAEADRLYPLRNRASDGSIGDAAHAARDSDHNPKPDGHGRMVVDALDLTHDPFHGFDAHRWIRAHMLAGDGRVKYAISARQIWTPDRGWHIYDGDNPHDKHVHTSVKPTDTARSDTSSWFSSTLVPTPPQEDSMARVPDPVGFCITTEGNLIITDGAGAIYAYNQAGGTTDAGYIDAYNAHPLLAIGSDRRCIGVYAHTTDEGYTQVFDDGARYSWA